MNEIDQKFEALAAEIRGLSEKEIYYRIRKHFDQVPREIQKSCMDFFNQFNYWGRLDPEKGVYEEIEEKGRRCLHIWRTLSGCIITWGTTGPRKPSMPF